MTAASWIEHLHCSKCRRTGEIELFEIAPFRNGVRKISGGFKVVAGQYGEAFHCEACAILVVQ
jgi:hypothetical protein